MKPPICPPCTQLRMRWLDTTPSQLLPSFGIAHGSGTPYDATTAGIRDNQRARHERWRQLVNEHMTAIADTCRAEGHTSSPAVAVVVELPLFDLLEEAA